MARNKGVPNEESEFQNGKLSILCVAFQKGLLCSQCIHSEAGNELELFKAKGGISYQACAPVDARANSRFVSWPACSLRQTLKRAATARRFVELKNFLKAVMILLAIKVTNLA